MNRHRRFDFNWNGGGFKPIARTVTRLLCRIRVEACLTQQAEVEKDAKLMTPYRPSTQINVCVGREGRKSEVPTGTTGGLRSARCTYICFVREVASVALKRKAVYVLIIVERGCVEGPVNSAHLPQCVEGGDPRQQQNDNSSRPQQKLHGKWQPEDTSADDGSDVVKCAVPPMTHQRQITGQLSRLRLLSGCVRSSFIQRGIKKSAPRGSDSCVHSYLRNSSL